MENQSCDQLIYTVLRKRKAIKHGPVTVYVTVFVKKNHSFKERKTTFDIFRISGESFADLGLGLGDISIFSANFDVRNLVLDQVNIVTSIGSYFLSFIDFRTAHMSY